MMSNSIRTAFLLVLLFVILFALVFSGFFVFQLWMTRFDPDIDALATSVQALRFFAPYIALGGVVWIAFSFLAHQMMIATTTGMHVLKDGRLPGLRRMLERLSARAGIPTPRLAIIETPEMNAFASGISRDDYTVTFTTGLLEGLTNEEIEGVMAHELAHIKNKDVRLMVIAATVTGGIALLFEGFYLLVSHGISVAVASVVGDGDDDIISGWLAGLLFLPILIVAWFITQLTSLAISRTREYMADAGAAEITGNPRALISALNKITEDCDIDAPTGVMRMCIQSPDYLFDLFSTHPRVEDRIAALEALQPLQTQADRSIARAQSARSSIKHAPAGLKPRAAFGRR